MNQSRATLTINAKWELAALAPVFALCVAQRQPWRRQYDDDRLTECDDVLFLHPNGAAFLVSVPTAGRHHVPTVADVLATAGSVVAWHRE